AQSGIFNNASQHWNHNEFWKMMGPGENKKMPGALEKAITGSFGSVQKFKDDFAAAGAGQFGSGWAWLVKDKDGGLKVTKTENGVNPLCFGQTALLGCDVWEHSYYIDFRNKRPAYLTNFLDKLVNWEDVASRLWRDPPPRRPDRPAGDRPGRPLRFAALGSPLFEAEAPEVARVPAVRAAVHDGPVLHVDADVVAAGGHAGGVEFPGAHRPVGVERERGIADRHGGTPAGEGRREECGRGGRGDHHRAAGGLRKRRDVDEEAARVVPGHRIGAGDHLADAELAAVAGAAGDLDIGRRRGVVDHEGLRRRH